MFEERIAVIEEFLKEFAIPNPLARVARAHAYYFAALLSYYSKEIPGRRTIIKSFWIRKGIVEESQLRVLAYVALMPLSFHLKPVMEKFVGKWIRARK